MGPEEVSECSDSYTGQYIKKMLKKYKDNLEKYR